MPKFVCPTCQCEYRPKELGITVVEMASFGPYKLWQADLYECRGCGAEIVGGFCDKPIQHFEERFNEVLQALVKAKAHIIYDFERPSPLAENPFRMSGTGSVHIMEEFSQGSDGTD